MQATMKATVALMHEAIALISAGRHSHSANRSINATPGSRMGGFAETDRSHATEGVKSIIAGITYSLPLPCQSSTIDSSPRPHHHPCFELCQEYHRLLRSDHGSSNLHLSDPHSLLSFEEIRCQ